MMDGCQQWNGWLQAGLDLKDDNEADGEARYLDLHTYVGKT